MKMRIKESQLRNIVKKALNEYVAKTDRKVVNANKMSGEYQQLFSGEGITKVPTYIVIVSNFSNPDTYDEFTCFAEDRMGGGTNYDSGLGYLNSRLDGKINQLFGVPRYTDTLRNASVGTVQQDPINFSYSPLSKNCPLAFDDYGYVYPREGAENLFTDFEKYGGDCEGWTFATVHPDKQEVLFFFDEVVDKNTFVRAIKNMFMIARHTIKNGQTVYRFSSDDNKQLSIIEYGGEKGGVDPLPFLDQTQDADIIQAIQGIIQAQQGAKDEEERMLDPEYLEQKAAEEQSKREKNADAVLNAYAPSFLSPSPSLARNNATVDESTLIKMIKESIQNVINNK